MRFRYESACVACAVLLLTLALSACKKQESYAPPPPPPPSPVVSPTPTPGPQLERIAATPEAVEKAEEELQKAADLDRRMRAGLTFEEFKATVYREPFEGGKYIVNGDTPIANEKQLREFFEEKVKMRQKTRLILDQVSGLDNKWNQQQKGNLTYCVSKTFGPRFDSVVQQIANATGEWEKVAA